MNRRTFLLSCVTACCYRFLKLVRQDKQPPEEPGIQNTQSRKTLGRLRLEEFWAEDR
jgi:hypothetical protein